MLKSGINSGMLMPLTVPFFSLIEGCLNETHE